MDRQTEAHRGAPPARRSQRSACEAQLAVCTDSRGSEPSRHHCLPVRPSGWGNACRVRGAPWSTCTCCRLRSLWNPGWGGHPSGSLLVPCGPLRAHLPSPSPRACPSGSLPGVSAQMSQRPWFSATQCAVSPGWPAPSRCGLCARGPRRQPAVRRGGGSVFVRRAAGSHLKELGCGVERS